MQSATRLSKDTKVPINEIPAGGLTFSFDQASAELNDSLHDLLGDFPAYLAQLSLKTIKPTLVELKGSLEGEINNICSRCAENFMSRFNKKFTTVYYKSEDNIKSLSGAMNDVEGDLDLELLDGNDIDLAEVVHEQVALEIPFQPLCTDSCKGLCSHCGANLNYESCNCQLNRVPENNSPFEILKVLKGDQ